MKPPHLPPINETALREHSWPDIFQSVTLDEFVASYLIDYNGRKALRRLGVWKGREAQVAEILLERDDVQNELSLRQLEVTEANMAAIRARACRGCISWRWGLNPSPSGCRPWGACWT